MRKVIAFLSTLSLSIPSISIVSACNDLKNDEVKVEFELISKIEVKKTYNNKFGIRFFKENVIEKSIFPNDFWYLTDDGKYLAEFNNINNESKQRIINVLKIKDTDYYPDFTLFNGWDLKNVFLNYKDNNLKEIINFNAILVADISILLRNKPIGGGSIEEIIDQEWINNQGKFTEKWFNFVETNQEFINKLQNIFISGVKKQINLDITILDFDLEVWWAPSNIHTDINGNVISFVISVDITGKNQLRNKYSYEVTIS